MHCNKLIISNFHYRSLHSSTYRLVYLLAEVKKFCPLSAMNHCGIGIPDRMTKPRTKNGLLASLMSEARERFFGWYMVEQDLVDIEEAGHEIPLPIQLGGSGEQRVVNCQRGLGQSPGQKRIWCILFGTEPIWWKKNSVCLLMTILAQINHIHFIKLHNNDIIILS